MRDLAIVLAIYDGYYDMWDDCITRLKKYWKNHPPIYIFTNEIQEDWGNGIKCFAVGKEAEWSRKIQKAIEVVSEEYFILLLEDFFVGDKINEAQVDELFNFVLAHQIDYVKLCDNNRIVHKKKKKYDSNFSFEVIYEDEEDAVCLQPTLWRKEYLQKLVGTENYNAWIFELNQIKNARVSPHRLCDNKVEDGRNILHIKHGALQGKLLPHTVRYFNRIGDPLLTTRKMMDSKDYRQYIVKQFFRDISPKFARKAIKCVAKTLGYSFVSDKWIEGNAK